MPCLAAPQGDQIPSDRPEALLRFLATGEVDPWLGGVVAWRPRPCNARTAALVGLAALVAVGAGDASYRVLVRAALENEATADDVIGILRAVAFVVGLPRLVAASTSVALALGYDLEADFERAP